MQLRAALRYGAALLAIVPALTFATPYPGFLQPQEVVELAAPELAIVSAVNVAAGDRVKAGQVLVELDTRALEASLAVAAARRDARADLAAASARHELRRNRSAQLTAAHRDGYAQADELAQATAELAVAAAELDAAHERRRIARLEYERIAVQIARHRITSPLDATVLEVRRRVGEIVTPADHVLLVLATLDKLIVRLNIAAVDGGELAPGGTLSGHCAGHTAAARVNRIAPVIDGATATREIELEIDNSSTALLSGMACEFDL